MPRMKVWDEKSQAWVYADGVVTVDPGVDTTLTKSDAAANAKAVGDALTYAGRNLVNTAKPISANSNVDTKWQTVILRYEEDKDTYFNLATTEKLVDGEPYVLSFDCIGVPADLQGKKLEFMVGKVGVKTKFDLTNGRMVIPFIGNGKVTLLIDDTTGSASYRPNSDIVGEGIFLSNFSIEKGSFSLGYQHKYPVLTTEQKNQIKALAESYYNVGKDVGNTKATFHYDTNVMRNDFANSRCYDPYGECDSFALCCITFAEMVWMGRDVKDFVGKNRDTYSNKITQAFDWGYYFDFNDRKNAAGICKKDEEGKVAGYYNFRNPNEDKTNFKNSYSTNSRFDYSLADTEANRKKYPMLNWFKSFMYANDAAQELSRMGCEIPFEELDIGDLIFTSPRYDLDTESATFFGKMCWRNITHVAMVYDKAADGTLTFIDCSNHFAVDDFRQCIYLSSTSYTNPFDIVKSTGLMNNIVMCARHPAAWGKSNMANIDRIDYMPMRETTGYSTGQAIPFTAGMAVEEGLWYVYNNELGKAKTTGNASAWSSTYFDIQYKNNG